MIEVVSVRFNSKGKIYYFDPSGITVKPGENVIVETAKGLEYAECALGNHAVEDTMVVQPLRPIVRLATEHDKQAVEKSKEKEKEAFDYCQRRITDYGLDMKLVDVEYGFEGSKILFFFTSEGRVDFRELVKDLAGVFKTRIELRQIGVRDEAKMLGGLGVCGKQFCCSQFLNEFHPVSIKMAKTQGLSLNPAKISGTCGRLMCCLKYEEAAYEDLVKKAPKVDSFVETPSGKGSVINVNLLRGNAKVRLEDGLDTTLKTFTFEELDVLGGKARRAEYIAARAEGKLEEAGFTVTPPPAAPPREIKQERHAGTGRSQNYSPQQPFRQNTRKPNNSRQEPRPGFEPRKKPPAERRAVEKEVTRPDIKHAGTDVTRNKKPPQKYYRGGRKQYDRKRDRGSDNTADQ